jgi:hypothetical protein
MKKKLTKVEGDWGKAPLVVGKDIFWGPQRGKKGPTDLDLGGPFWGWF